MAGAGGCGCRCGRWWWQMWTVEGGVWYCPPHQPFLCCTYLSAVGTSLLEILTCSHQRLSFVFLQFRPCRLLSFLRRGRFCLRGRRRCADRSRNGQGPEGPRDLPLRMGAFWACARFVKVSCCCAGRWCMPVVLLLFLCPLTLEQRRLGLPSCRNIDGSTCAYTRPFTRSLSASHTYVTVIIILCVVYISCRIAMQVNATLKECGVEGVTASSIGELSTTNSAILVHLVNGMDATETSSGGACLLACVLAWTMVDTWAGADVLIYAQVLLLVVTTSAWRCYATLAFFLTPLQSTTCPVLSSLPCCSNGSGGPGRPRQRRHCVGFRARYSLAYPGRGLERDQPSPGACVRALIHAHTCLSDGCAGRCRAAVAVVVLPRTLDAPTANAQPASINVTSSILPVWMDVMDYLLLAHKSLA